MAGERGSYVAPSALAVPSGMNARWWSVDGREEAAAAMVARGRQIDDNQRWRRDELLVYGSFYSGRQLPSLYQFGSMRSRSPLTPWNMPVLGHRVTWNVAQSCVDTLAAKISKNRVRPLFQTIDGNFSDKLKAEQLQKFIDGVFYETDFYESVADKCFVDASIFDGGVAKVYPDRQNGCIRIERVMPFEILIDEAEAMYGKPLTLYQRQFRPRAEVMEQFGRKGPDREVVAQAIENATDTERGDLLRITPGDIPDMVPVFEAWRLPSGPGQPGRHMVSLPGTCLLDEPWTDDDFPFAFYIDTPLPAGIWGKGVVEQVAGIQIEINKILRTIQVAQHRLAMGRWAVAKGSVATSHINNVPGEIIEYMGDKPPVAFVAQAMGPEIYQWVETLFTKAFEITGITALSATGAKPAGLDAGVAIREYHDIESERFVKKGQRFERFVLAVCEKVIDSARTLYASGKDMRVKAMGSRTIEAINWSQVNLKNDAFVMRVFPTSILPSTPAGRYQTVKEMMADGFVGPEQAISLLDMPDVEGYMSLASAAYRDIERIIAKILDKGEYEPPEPYGDLNLAVKVGQSAYLRARNEGADDKRLDLLCRWIDEAQEMAKMIAPPPVAPLPGPAGPQGAPAAPPGMEALAGAFAPPSEMPIS